ncbi:MAG: NlpC/P60 family protein [Actinomycetota bacterium]|nr:NlpC/P60 family protein [Actinomycetota bacterium]
MIRRTRNGRVALAAAAASLIAMSTLTTGAHSWAAPPTQNELEEAQDRLHELEAEFEIVVERYNLVNERLDQLQSRISDARAKIDELEKSMAVSEDQAVDLATELYKGGSTESLEAILSSDSLSEIDARVTYLESTDEANSKIFEDLATDKALLEDLLGDLTDAQEQAQKSKEELAELRVDIDAKLADQADEIADLQAQIEEAERLREEREARLREQQEQQQQQSAPAPPSAPAPNISGTNSRAGIAVNAALSQVGKPYQWGAAGPDSYDCSGLTMWAWAQAGVGLPHNSGMQYSSLPHVSTSSLQPGDLLFFGSPIHHVGMYVGGGQMVEAPYTGSQVRVVSWQRSDFVGAARPGI